MEERTAFIVEGVLLLVIGMVGIVGNVTAIIVFAREKLQKNFHALMLSLAAFDLAYILASILLFSIPQFSDDYMESGFYWHILPWVLPIAQIGITGSIYFTMAITVERYVTVCHPFFRVAHNWPAKAMVFPIVAFAILYNIPKFFELRTKVPGDHSYDNLEAAINVTVLNGTMEPETDEYGIIPTQMRLDPYYIKIYCMWLNFLLMGLGPFVLLITLNTLTLRELKTMAAQISRGPHYGASGPISVTTRKKDLALATVSLAIVFVFIVCHSIKWIPNIYELIQIDKGPPVWPPWIELVTNISHLLTTFNSSVNFYIYLAKHWRTVFNIGSASSRGSAETRRDTLWLRSSMQHDHSHFAEHGDSIRTLAANNLSHPSETSRMLVVVEQKPPDVVAGTTNATTNFARPIENGDTNGHH